MDYLSPRPNHRDSVRYFVNLLDKSLADYLAGNIQLGMLAIDIEGFAETIWNHYDGQFGWVDGFDDLYWTVSIPFFNGEVFSDAKLGYIHRNLTHLRTELAKWWAEYGLSTD